MTPENAILAGTLAKMRETIREHFRSGHTLRIGSANSGSTTPDVYLDRKMTQDALNAIDEGLTKRLEKMGVSDL